jgi:acyl transferase domain-containing protein
MVTGCNLAFSPEYFAWMTNLNFLSPDSRCYSFDSRANGYARGEGIGVIILKRLSDALRDGNTIRAVIRSAASNEDGRTPGITQPSSDAQERLIRETYRRAGLSMAHTRYFEAQYVSAKSDFFHRKGPCLEDKDSRSKAGRTDSADKVTSLFTCPTYNCAVAYSYM